MDEFIEVSSNNVDGFVTLYQSVFNAPPWNDGWTKLAVIERLNAFAGIPSFKGLAIMRNGQALGFVLGWGERWINGWEFHIKEMCVDPAYQRQGIGRSLMQHFEERLSKDGFIGLTLQTGGQTPARTFYESLGWKPINLVTLNKTLNSSA